MKKVLVIVGPTGSGKTKLSISLAKRFQGEIINGDSVQVLKGYDIGSAKITNKEMQGIKHHLLSYVDPASPYDVSKFQQEGRACIHNIEFPIVCGGTGLYIKALLYDYEFKTYQMKEDDITLNEKIEYIKANDPNIQLDFLNERRVEGAYRMMMNGFKKSDMNKKHIPLYDVLAIYLDVDRTKLKYTLEKRLENQFQEGFIEEVIALKKISQIKDVIGYKEINQYLDGNMDYDHMKIEIITKSMGFAKKQKTWFKNQMQVMTFDAIDSNLENKVVEVVKTWLK